jgi:hypothetical protein
VESKDIGVNQPKDCSHTRVVFEKLLIFFQQRNVLADLLIGVEQNVEGVGPGARYLKRKEELAFFIPARARSENVKELNLGRHVVMRISSTNNLSRASCVAQMCPVQARFCRRNSSN